MFKDFKVFIMRGNVLDMAIGIIIGGAFGTIVKSLVDDVLMPPIGMLLGNVDFTDRFILLKHGTTALPPGASLEQAKAAGAVTLNYGMFINAVIAFLIIAFCVYLVVRAANKLQGPAEAAVPTTKDCPYCATAIPLAAKKCPNCTTAL
jgi:large conductance mechanosensitive channel